MKKKDIEKNDEPKLEEVGKFHYVKGSISFFSHEPSLEEEHWDRKRDTLDRAKAGLCLRCGTPLEEGMISCPQCGKVVHIE